MLCYKEKQNDKNTENLLQSELCDVGREQTFLANSVKLSEDLDKKMKDSKASLNKKIYGLNYYLFDMIYKK